MSDPAAGPPRRPSTSVAADVSQTTPTRDAREQMVAELSRHFTEDRLSLDEFDRRAALVYSATSVADLAALTADVAVPTVPARDAESRIVAFLSNQERQGAGAVPRRQVIACTFANVELDLRQATFGEGVSEVEVSCVFGNVGITVPAHVRVELTGSAIIGSFGSFGSRAEGLGGSGSIVLRISGRAVFGNVEVHQGRWGASPALRPPDQ